MLVDKGGGSWIGLNVYLFEFSSICLVDIDGHTKFEELVSVGAFSLVDGDTGLDELVAVLSTTVALLFFSSSQFVSILESLLGAVIINEDIELAFGDDGIVANGENGEDWVDLTAFNDLELLYEIELDKKIEYFQQAIFIYPV